MGYQCQADHARAMRKREIKEARAGARGSGGGGVGVGGGGGRDKRRSEWRCHLEAKL